METEARKAFGDGQNGSAGAIGMDMMDMFQDMPLVSVLMFQQRALPVHPEDIVAGLLQRVHGEG